MMQRRYDDTYGAGLWKENLQIGLIWYVVEFQSSRTALENGTPSQCIAPSFSWASMTGQQVRFCNCEESARSVTPSHRQSLELLHWDSSYVPGPLAPFGEVTSGSVRVRGYLRQASLVLGVNGNTPRLADAIRDRTGAFMLPAASLNCFWGLSHSTLPPHFGISQKDTKILSSCARMLSVAHSRLSVTGRQRRSHCRTCPKQE